MTSSVAKLLQSMDTLPPLPQSAQRLQFLMSDPDSSAAEITREIARDPALASRLLKIVNSAYYGVSGRVSSLSHAIVLLGYTQVRNIVLAVSIKQIWRTSDAATQQSREQLWKHCLATAVISQELARRIDYGQQEEMFIGGLLSDLGKFILDCYAHDQYESVLNEVKTAGGAFYDAEQRLLGEWTHAKIGGMAAKRWNLPSLLADMICFHHEPSACAGNRVEVAIAHVADCLARMKGVGNSGDNVIPRLDPDAWRRLNLGGADLTVLMRDLDRLLESDVLLNEPDLW